MSLIIRPVQEKDAEGILEIYNEAILNTTAVYEYEPYTIDVIVKMLADKKLNGFPFLIAESLDRVAGFASYGPFRLRPAYKYAVEHSVYVHPDFRRQGIAKLLLEQLIELASQKEIHTIVAGIDGFNTHSIQLHEKFGFREVGYIPEVGFKSGRWLDLKFMQLILSDRFKPVDG